MTKRKWLATIIFLFAIVIRLILLYPQFSGDVKNHLAWGNGFLENPLGFYGRHFTGYNNPNYPPVTIFLFALCNLLLNSLNIAFSYLNVHLSIFPSFLVPLFSSENMHMGFLKLPGIVSDIGIGVLIYKILEKRREKKSLFITSLYLFNPAVLYTSSVWGQIESVTIFPLILSLYLSLFSKKQRYFSILIFAFAALTKQTALWFLPLYLFLWFKEIKLRDWVVGTLTSFGLFFLSYLPFGLNPIQAIVSYLSTLTGSSTVVADAAWNVWYYLFPYGTEDSVRVGIFSVRQISIFLIVAFLILFLFRLSKKYSSNTFLNYLFLWSLVVFFLQTRVHERHLAPALVFLLLTPAFSTRLFVDYFLISVYHMYNLYWSLKLPFI